MQRPHVPTTRAVGAVTFADIHDFSMIARTRILGYRGFRRLPEHPRLARAPHYQAGHRATEHSDQTRGPSASGPPRVQEAGAGRAVRGMDQ